ncbi:hypothetical protein EV207_1477 [Scopulibacillus darangshiensis]|uniref:Uncharacterized protein n=1 Tax=Scopulibacillus darangshiensis TaxID=442528 RepID=A0A4R2NHT8_9BACL|nr:hypothetical protein EV207_1477 [Scopulibacillus darangshiensis]
MELPLLKEAVFLNWGLTKGVSPIQTLTLIIKGARG